MSYCRFMDSDVYMFPHVRGGIECCFCSLVHGSINFPTHKEALEHLLEHRAAGHDVPEYAIRRLQEEMGEAIREADGD